jgi:hypothetical protein
VLGNKRVIDPYRFAAVAQKVTLAASNSTAAPTPTVAGPTTAGSGRSPSFEPRASVKESGGPGTILPATGPGTSYEAARHLKTATLFFRRA